MWVSTSNLTAVGQTVRQYIPPYVSWSLKVIESDTNRSGTYDFLNMGPSVPVQTSKSQIFMTTVFITPPRVLPFEFCNGVCAQKKLQWGPRTRLVSEKKVWLYIICNRFDSIEQTERQTCHSLSTLRVSMGSGISMGQSSMLLFSNAKVYILAPFSGLWGIMRQNPDWKIIRLRTMYTNPRKKWC